MDELGIIRSETLERLKRTEMFRRLQGTSLDRNTYAGYLVNVYHYARHSPHVISLAGSRAVQSNPRLAAYLMRHATEEIGHERWAHSDLLRLGLTEDQIRASRPGTYCTSMIGMEYFVAGHWNPLALFGWLFVLEALGDDVGHFVAGRLDSSLRLDSSATYFLRAHGTADHDHIRDIVEAIQEHMKDPNDIADMLHIAKVSGDLYLGILDEVVEEGRAWV
jgi:pyrroloquinoline quinone (PQQ) biosynthesis protein C